MDKRTSACCFLCLLLRFHAVAEQAVRLQRVKPDLTHLSDNIRTYSFHFIALHALEMQTPRSNLRLFCFFHSSSRVHCCPRTQQRTSTWIQTDLKWEGITVIVPWPWAQPPVPLTALSFRRSLHLNQICLETPLNLMHTRRDSGQESGIDPLTLQATR